MIPHIPSQRKFKSNKSKPFDDLIDYIQGDKEQEQGKQQELSNQFNDMLDYATSPIDKETKGEKCIAIRTHGVNGLATACAEMNAVASQNTRCEDPVYHIILSWPEHEKPAPESIFDAAEHALLALGLAEHQYVVAVHGNTDNMHCHISVNRVHPITFKSRHIEWATKTLHMAARQSEIKHGWTHDNGIYVVEVDGHGKKRIVLNKEHAETVSMLEPRVHQDLGREEVLPSWHDPDSLESWLKTNVAKALKRDLPALTGWVALHAWLSKYGITLTDSGGSGMRLQATSYETGEVLDLAASKGLRLLKRSELEKRWGKFANSTPVPCIVPDLSHLTPNQIAKGVDHVIRNTLDGGRPPEHVIRAQQLAERDAAERSGGMHELPVGRVDGAGPDGPVPLPDALQDRLGNREAGEDPDMRRTGATEARSRSGRSLSRDDSKRAERREQRAAARADLRQRFAQYKRFVRGGDTEYFMRAKEIQTGRSQALKEIRQEAKAAKSGIPKGAPADVRLLSNVEIDAESLRRKLQVEYAFQERGLSLRATRTPPLSWRAWLHEQSNLGDRAALSALRGIVYQAQRDAKGTSSADADEMEEDGAAYREQQYRKVMARLLEEEKKEAAIRSASSRAMRPFEIDALLVRYAGIQWRVTGNGNVEYSDVGGDHLFTDRGNRVTFDRVRVSDDDIRLALIHAEQKFGKTLTLTGDDSEFGARMARIADDMGMTVLNPDLQLVITNHRAARVLEIAEAVTIPPLLFNDGVQSIPAQARRAPISEIVPAESAEDRLRAIILSIDPRATFVVPDPSNSPYPFVGPVAAKLDGAAPGFAQRTGRGVYALHAFNAPENHNDDGIEVLYRNGQGLASVQDQGDPGKGKGRSQ